MINEFLKGINYNDLVEVTAALYHDSGVGKHYFSNIKVTTTIRYEDVGSIEMVRCLRHALEREDIQKLYKGEIRIDYNSLVMYYKGELIRLPSMEVNEASYTPTTISYFMETLCYGNYSELLRSLTMLNCQIIHVEFIECNASNGKCEYIIMSPFTLATYVTYDDLLNDVSKNSYLTTQSGIVTLKATINTEVCDITITLIRGDINE